MDAPVFVTRWNSATHGADFGVDAEGQIWQYLDYEGCPNPRWIMVRDDEIERQARGSLVDELAAEREAHEATRQVLSRYRDAERALAEWGLREVSGLSTGPDDYAELHWRYTEAAEAADAALTPIGTGYGKPSNSPAEKLDLDTGPAR